MRLKAEMGLNYQLEEVGSFIYRADIGGVLVEHEFDHLLLGRPDLNPSLNIAEAADWNRVPFVALGAEHSKRLEDFTCWLRLIVDIQLHKFPATL